MTNINLQSMDDQKNKQQEVLVVPNNKDKSLDRKWYSRWYDSKDWGTGMKTALIEHYGELGLGEYLFNGGMLIRKGSRKGVKFTHFDNTRSFLKFYNGVDKSCDYHEFILEYQPTKLVIDLDLKKYPDDLDINLYLKCLIKSAYRVIYGAFEIDTARQSDIAYGDIEDDDDIIICCSSGIDDGHYKHSYHIIFRYFVIDSRVAIEFITLLQRFFYDCHPEYDFGGEEEPIDNFYKSSYSLRLADSCKNGRKKEIVNGIDTIKDTLLTYNPDEKFKLSYKEILKEIEEYEKSEITVEDEEINKLLVDAGFKGLFYTENTKNIVFRKEEEGYCPICDKNHGGLGGAIWGFNGWINYTCFRATTYSPDKKWMNIYKPVIGVTDGIPDVVNPKVDICWSDLELKYEPCEVDQYTIEEIKKFLIQTVVKTTVASKGRYLLKSIIEDVFGTRRVTLNPQSITDFKSIARDIIFKITQKNDKDVLEVVNINLYEIFQLVRKQCSYQQAFFIPCSTDFIKSLTERKRRCISTFLGFVGDIEVDGNAEEVCQPILDHMRNILCDGDDECYRFLLSLLSHIVKNPSIKTEMCTIFQGLEGGGKTCFLKFLREKVFGEDYSIDCSIKEACRKFNILSKNRVIVTFTESKNYEGNEFHDKLKKIISDYNQHIEEKNVNPEDLKNFANYFLDTNSYNPVTVTKNDRRFFCLAVNNKYAKNVAPKEERIKYFTQLHNCFDIAGPYFFNYLKNLDMVYFPDDVPMTEFKKLLEEDSYGLPLEFLKDYYIDRKPNNKVHLVTLYNSFINWGKDQGINITYKSRTFNKEMKRIFGSSSINYYRMNGSQKLGIDFQQINLLTSITRNTSLEFMQKYLDEDDGNDNEKFDTNNW